MSPEGEVGMLLVVVVVQLSSGCGRNEWNAAFGQGSSGGERGRCKEEVVMVAEL